MNQVFNLEYAKSTSLISVAELHGWSFYTATLPTLLDARRIDECLKFDAYRLTSLVALLSAN